MASPSSILLQDLTEAVSLGYPLEPMSTTLIHEKAPSAHLLGHPSGGSQTDNRISGSTVISGSNTWITEISLGSESVFDASASLARRNTIQGVGSSPSRSTRELKAILGSTSAKLKGGATLPPTESDDPFYHPQHSVLHLEGGQSWARVQLDLLLESDSCVHGGHLTGNIVIDIRKKPDSNQIVMLSDGKLRLIGFECVMQEKERCIFYQCTASMSSVMNNLEEIYRSGPDDEGFMLANDGHYVLPFSFYLDPAATLGTPKGSFPPHSGAAIRYIVMASIRIKDPISEKKSIAHFYRNACVWPHLDLAGSLAPLPRPIQVTMSDTEGAIKFTVTLHRLQWIAGQRCSVNVFVANKSTKSIKGLTIGLHRDTIIYRPRENLDDVGKDADDGRTITTSKLIVETSLVLGDRSEKGYASAKGWWTGVFPGESHQTKYFILLPTNTLSIAKGNLLEIAYRLRVTISTGNILPTELSAEVPIQIVNFISFDTSHNVTKIGTEHQSSLSSNLTQTQRRLNDLSKVLLARTLDVSTVGSRIMLHHEDNDDVVRDVVIAAPSLDPEEGEQPHHFADLYYSTLQNDLDQQPQSSERSKGPIDIMKAQIPMSKLPPEMRSEARTRSSLRAIPELESELERTPICQDAEAPLEGLPSRMTTSLSPGDHTPSRRARSVMRAARSRTLPIPPNPAGVSAFEELKLGTKKNRHLRGHSDTSVPQFAQDAFLQLRASLSSTSDLGTKSPGTPSVKDKIRELEKRVKAIEIVSQAD